MALYDGPLTTAGLVQWFRADKGIVMQTGSPVLVSGSTVSNWLNLTGGGNDFTNGLNIYGPGGLPTWKDSNLLLNRRPALQFAGGTGGQAMGCPRVISDDFTYYTVWQSTAGGTDSVSFWNNACLFGCGGPGYTNEFGISIGNTGVVMAWVEAVVVGPTTITAPSGFHNGQAHVASFRRTKASGFMELFIDGRRIGTATGPTASLTSQTTMVIAESAESPWNFASLTGAISEIVVYDRVLSDFEHLNNLRYLQLRYGIQTYRV